MIIQRLAGFVSLSLICLFSLFNCSHLTAQEAQLESLRVARIDIELQNCPEGVTFEASAVRSRIQTKVGALFSQVEFDQDLKCLAEEYDQIDPILQVFNKELYVTLKIWTKPTIREIRFVGQEKIKESKLCKELDIEVGSLFSREEFIIGFNKVKNYYIKKGYFEAELDFTIIPLPNCNEIDIEICIKEGRAGRIKNVNFCGLDECEEDDILDLIYTKRYLFWLSWFTGTGVYNEDMLEHDRLVILSYLQNLGYADAILEISIEEIDDCDRINVLISANKGQRYTFGTVQIDGFCSFTEEEIISQFTFCGGGNYSPEEVRNTTKNLRDLYGSKGFIEVVVDYQLSLRDDEPVYDLNMTIEEGDPYYVGLIHVFGNRCCESNVILHECLLVPGEVFDIRRLEATETRLVNTGYFKNVNVYAVKTPDEACLGAYYRDVYIEVEETETGHLGVFFGISTQDSIFGGIEIAEQNFNYRGFSRLFKDGPSALRGGGEFANLKASIGAKQTTYLAQWTKPHFMDSSWIVGFDLEKSFNRAITSEYDVKTYGLLAHATYAFNPYFRTALHYRLKHTNISLDGSVKDPLLIEEARNHGLISAAGGGLIYDSTDSPRCPTGGFRSRLDAEFAGLGGNYTFFKFAYLNTYYLSITDRSVLKFRGDAIFIAPVGKTDADSLPFSERLYLGGDTTVRGYRPYSIGPQFLNHVPRGGISSLLLSEEYQYHVMNRIDAFIFVDAGYLSLREFDIGRPAVSYGVGVRVEIMKNMPMTLGMGFPIHANRSNVKNFFFSMGGYF